MILTKQNYFSPESNKKYMSVSQYKSWMECPAKTIHWLNPGEPEEETDALVAGRYVHSWAESPEAFAEFKLQNSAYIYNKKGEPYAPFKKADEMIEVLEADPKIRFYLNGTHETILTAELFGVPWKIMVDIDNDPLGYLADLKTAASITEFKYDPRVGRRVSFIEQWDYMIQAAVYSEVERIARDRDTHKDFYIIAVSKEKAVDHAIIDLTDPARIAEELALIEANLPRILLVKSGAEPPTRCECCAYCRGTKRVGRPVHYTELKEMY